MIDDALVIVPAFNEARAIGETITELKKTASHILVVDDGSKDGTSARAQAAGAEVLRLATNLNYGGALQAGFRYALRRTSFPYIVTFDADGQHDAAYLDPLIAPLREGGADYVVGSRYLDGGGHDSAVRDLGIRLFARAASRLSGRPVTDPTSGFTAMTRETAGIFLGDLYPQDFPDADVIIMLGRMGMRVRETPVTMRPSQSGKSMHGGLVRPLFYIAKMSVSMIHLAARRDLAQKRKEAAIAA